MTKKNGDIHLFTVYYFLCHLYSFVRFPFLFLIHFPLLTSYEIIRTVTNTRNTCETKIIVKHSKTALVSGTF